MSNYSALLRDPRWQKKRLEILSRDQFTCRRCSDGHATLNVHHCYYASGNDPWDYPDESLVTLCESCHEHESANARAAKAGLYALLGKQGRLVDDVLHFCTLFDRPEGRDLLTVVTGWLASGRSAEVLLDQIVVLWKSEPLREAAHG